MPTEIRWKRPPIKTAAAGPVMNKEIRDELKLLGEQVVAIYYDPVVEFWNEKPEFKVNAIATEKKISLSIVAKHSDKIIVDRWHMVDSKGRKEGKKIPASNPSGVMRFQDGYYRKTNFGVRLSAGTPGERFGDWHTRREVTQGAVEPLYITRTVQEKIIDPNTGRRVRNAYRRAFRKVAGRSI